MDKKLPGELVDAVFDELARRKGFRPWWEGDIPYDSIREEIKENARVRVWNVLLRHGIAPMPGIEREEHNG